MITKPRNRVLAVGLAMATFVAMASGCSSSGSSGSAEGSAAASSAATGAATGGEGAGSAGPVDTSNLQIVASVINTTNPYFASNIAGAQALGKKLGIPVQIVDSEGSSQKEISKIQAILAQGDKKNIVFVNTVASSDVPPIINACKQADAYCTIWWNKPDDYEPWDQGDNFVAFQKHGGVDSGRCTAKTLSEAIGEGGIIALGGVQDSTTSQTRIAGLQDELKKFPNVKLLEVRPANWDPQLAFQETQNMIAKYGDQIKGIWAADDGMIIGAKEAVDKSPLKGKVKFTSDGLYPPVIGIMKSPDNPIVGETFHRGYMASAIGLYTAYLAATGQITPSELPKEKRNSIFKIACVTPENLDEYTKYDDNIDAWIDELIAKGPWDTEPVPLVAGGPEVLPQ
jgi:ribose transport system substrate-binding protein